MLLVKRIICVFSIQTPSPKKQNPQPAPKNKSPNPKPPPQKTKPPTKFNPSKNKSLQTAKYKNLSPLNITLALTAILSE